MDILWSDNGSYQRELEENCAADLEYGAFRGVNILITGATGLIGSYLADTFLKMNETLHLGLHITAFCHSKSKAQKRFADALDRSDFELICGAVEDSESYRQSTWYGQWDYVIHCAGNAHPRAFSVQPVETMKANLFGTLNLLEIAVAQEVKHPVKKILFLSSGEVYGTGRELSSAGFAENDPGTVDSMDPRSCYPEGKRAAETLCCAYAGEYGVPAVVARLGYIYGPTMQTDNTRADVQFLSKAAIGEAIVMKSTGEQYRSYCYLKDAALGLLLLLQKGEPGEAYNISNSESCATIREFAETIAEVFGVPLRFERPDLTEQGGYSKMQREILNASKLEALGWKPVYGLRQGIEKICGILWENDWAQCRKEEEIWTNGIKS